MFDLIITILAKIITIAFIPIDTIVSNYMPNLDSALSKVTTFFNYLQNYSSFIMSYTGLNRDVISICITLFVTTITLPTLVHGIKLGLKWWEELV